MFVWTMIDPQVCLRVNSLITEKESPNPQESFRKHITNILSSKLHSVKSRLRQRKKFLQLKLIL